MKNAQSQTKVVEVEKPQSVNQIELQKQSIEDDVFSNSNNDPSVKIWGQVLLNIKNSGDNLLYAMCDCVTKSAIEQNEFCLYVCNRTNYEELNQMQTLAKLKSQLEKIVDLKLKIVFNEQVDENLENINYLKEKFGDKLKIKN